jgi:stringent starvation protein B
MANIQKPSGLNQLWAASGTRVDPGIQKIGIGWIVELPPFQYQNWIDNRQDTAIAHINQHGIPEWDGETEYQGNLSYTQGSDGFIYKCLVTHTNLNPVNPLNSTYWVRAFEAYGSVAVVQNQLTAHLTNYATLSGISNPVAARNNLSVYSKAESDIRFAALNGNQTQQFNAADATASTHVVTLGQLSTLLLGATETTAGQVILASVSDTETGTNDTKAITPLKAATVYSKKSNNLSDLPNKATARTNLGLGSIAVENAGSFLRASNNLSEITNPAVARNNLGLGTASTQPIGSFLLAANNLSDVPDKPTARTNLGLANTATMPASLFCLKADNLSGLANVASARSNLGLADSATIPSGTFMFRANNLGDVTNVQAARNNLGLGGLATANALGINGPNIVFQNGWDGNAGWTILPNGVKMQWGNIQAGGTINFPIPFTVSYSVQCQHGPNALGSPASGVTGKTLNGFTLGFGVGNYMWTAIGV